MRANESILSIKDLQIQFSLRGKKLTAVRGCSIDLPEGKTTAIVGESGAGKSVLVKSLLGMLDKNGSVSGGSIEFNGMDLAGFGDEKDWLKIRGKEIAYVFQDPMTSLSPLMTIGRQIEEAIILHHGVSRGEAAREAVEILTKVGIPDPEARAKQYPHEFSGGMRQRVVIAISIACRPRILVCDEPTTALDVTIQAQILKLIRDLQEEYGFTTVYITHDLGVVANVADFVAVMYAGKIIEYGLVEEIFYDSRHPYTWALLSSLPQLGKKGEDLYAIKGTPPNLFKEIKGDAFAPRNPQALEVDFHHEPPMIQISETHRAATWLLDERAPKIDRPAQLEEIKNISSNFLKGIHSGPPPAIDTSREEGEVLLSVKNLSVQFKTKHKGLFKAVDNVSFDIFKGETFGLVGESGSGKTTIGRTIIRLNPSSSGTIEFDGERINGKISSETDKMITSGIQMIFQDPMASLNERAKVHYIISEGLMNLRRDLSDSERMAIVENALNEVGLLPEFASRFPHEFSGGQRQRIGIARTVVMEPDLIIADEPISALDVSIRAQVLNLMSRLKKEKGLTYLFIAHDLSVMRFITDRIGVIYKGELVELAETEELYRTPLHPYTKALISAIPQPDPRVEKEKEILVYDGSVHNYSESDPPRWFELSPGRWIRANRAEEEEYRNILNSEKVAASDS